MKPIESVLVHKIVSPRKPEGTRYPTLILLHGRGANEDDLLPLAEHFDPHFLIISARAPYPFAYGGGYAWYEIDDVGIPEPTMHMESYRRIVRFIDDCIAGYPVDPKRIFLLGFSMGSMMSFTISLAHPERFAGVVANSGYIPEKTHVPYQWDNLGSLRFFIAHGTYDPIVPVQFGRRAKELLEETSADVDYHEYPMGHEISQQSLGDMAAWLSHHLNILSHTVL